MSKDCKENDLIWESYISEKRFDPDNVSYAAHIDDLALDIKTLIPSFYGGTPKLVQRYKSIVRPMLQKDPGLRDQIREMLLQAKGSSGFGMGASGDTRAGQGFRFTEDDVKEILGERPSDRTAQPGSGEEGVSRY